jgi:hypothetical protein
MSPFMLQVLNPVETPEQRRQRSVLYILAFCALVFACELAGQQSDVAAGGSLWPVWLAAILTGVIVLHIMTTLKETPSGATPSASRGQRTNALSDLATWRNQRASTFSGFKLDFSTDDNADKSSRAQSSNKRPRRKSKGHEGAGADPMAKALEDFVSRSNEHRKE